jgi:hypothetical protein
VEKFVEFTAQYINTVFQERRFDFPKVKVVRVEKLAGKKRFNADVWRLHVEYEREADEAPRTLIAKLPTDRDQLNANARVFQPGLRESWFYRTAAECSGIAVPRCYDNQIDPTTVQTVLLLEEVAGARSTTWLQGLNLLQARLALNAAARLHTAWWEKETSPEIRELTGALSKNAENEADLVGKLYDDAWPKFVKRFDKHIPAGVSQFGDAVVGNMRAVDRLLDLATKTLVHGDFRQDNLLFTVQNGEASCWVIDWEDCFYGSGLIDVSWLLGGGLQKGDIKEEANLLKYYFLSLIRSGVDGYSWEQCLDDYRRAMCSSFVQGVLTAVSGMNSKGYENKLAGAVALRFIFAAQRLQLIELLK